MQASQQTEDAAAAAWLHPELARMQSQDTELRLRLWAKGAPFSRFLTSYSIRHSIVSGQLCKNECRKQLPEQHVLSSCLLDWKPQETVGESLIHMSRGVHPSHFVLQAAQSRTFLGH